VLGRRKSPTRGGAGESGKTRGKLKRDPERRVLREGGGSNFEKKGKGGVMGGGKKTEVGPHQLDRHVQRRVYSSG